MNSRAEANPGVLTPESSEVSTQFLLESSDPLILPELGDLPIPLLLC